MQGWGTGGSLQLSWDLGEFTSHYNHPAWPLFTPVTSTLLPWSFLDQVCSEVSWQWEVPRKKLEARFALRRLLPFPGPHLPHPPLTLPPGNMSLACLLSNNSLGSGTLLPPPASPAPEAPIYSPARLDSDSPSLNWVSGRR